MPTSPVSSKYGAFARSLRRIDDRLGTRPLFAVAIFGEGLSRSDRTAVVVHTARTAAVRIRRAVRWRIVELAGALVLRRMLGGRPGMGGLRPVGGLASGWWQAITPSAAHRCRIALGRLTGPLGRASVTLFCGHDPQPGDLPVYVLFRAGRVIDMAFHAGEGSLSPGIGKLRPSPPENRAALRSLSALLAGSMADDDALEAFFQPLSARAP